MSYRAEPLSASHIIECIDLIHASSLDRSSWQIFTQRLQEVLNAEVASITLLHRNPDSADLYTTATPDFISNYCQYYFSVDPFAPFAWGGTPLGEVLRGEVVVGVQNLNRSEYFNDFMAPRNYRYGLGVALLRDPTELANLGVFLSAQHGPGTDDEIAFLQALVPHMQTAIRVQQRLDELTLLGGAMCEALEHVPYGVLFISSRGDLLQANARASSILALRDGLHLDRHRGLVASTSDETRTLKALLAQVFNRDQHPARSAGGLMRLSRPSLRLPLELLIAPFAPHDLPALKNHPIAILFITDPQAQAETFPQRLQRLYGLSPAEADVTMLLIQGLSLREIADDLQCGYETVRTHIKHAFSKTCTHRQADLVRLLLRSTATLER